MIDFTDTDNLWTFKYEPKSLDEYIASDSTRNMLKKVINEAPNFILSGPPGIGKGTFLNIFLNETGYDCLKVNASDDNGIVFMRDKVIPFISSLGMTKYKIVYLNEADNLTESAQKLLRDPIEAVHEHTRFALLCNDSNYLKDYILSRMLLIELNHPPADSIFNHCLNILQKENIEINNEIKKSIVKMIKTLYPDIRRIINSLQGSVIDGKLDSIIIFNNNLIYNEILKCIFEKDIEGVRTLLRNNVVNYPELYSLLFENVGKFKSPGDCIIEIAEYLYRNKTIAIPEINFMAMIVKMIKSGML